MLMSKRTKWEDKKYLESLTKDEVIKKYLDDDRNIFWGFISVMILIIVLTIVFAWGINTIGNQMIKNPLAVELSTKLCADNKMGVVLQTQHTTKGTIINCEKGTLSWASLVSDK